MKRVVWIFALLAVILLPGGVSAKTVVYTIFSDGHVVHDITDRVLVIRGNESLEVAPGFVLEEGDKLKTLEKAQVVLLHKPGSVEIYIDENSEIEIGSIFVRLGEIYVRVKEKLKEAFEVKSDYGVAGVEGTEFILRVNDEPDAETLFTCLTVEGKVRFTMPEYSEEPILIGAGEALKVDADRQPAKYMLSEEAMKSSRAPFAPLIEVQRQQVRDVQVVPNLLGVHESEVGSQLNKARLSVGEIKYVVSGPGAEIGVVLGQDPGSGMYLPPFEPVSLEIQGVLVPDLINLSVEDATKSLKNSGLELDEKERVFSVEIAIGNIVTQSIKAGEAVAKGSTIEIGVSKGPPPPMAPIGLENKE